jgi:hypothetical protein
MTLKDKSSLPQVRKIVVSANGGGIKPDDVRALNHVREREKAEIALFISVEQRTPVMVKDAALVGFYESPNGKKYPRVQLLTIEGLPDNTQRAEHPDYEPDELQESQGRKRRGAAVADLKSACCKTAKTWQVSPDLESKSRLPDKFRRFGVPIRSCKTDS